MHTLVLKSIFAVCLGSLIAGCGGGGGGESAPASPPPTTPTETLVATYTVVPARVVRSALCEDEITGLGGCVGINQQAEMPRIIPLEQQTPTTPGVIPFTRRTGSSGQVHTAQTGGTLYDIDTRSFAQTRAGSSEIGLYVNTIDRSTAIPATSVNPLYQFTTTPPASGETDRRVMPWKDAIARDVELSFEIAVKTFRRAAGQTNDQSFAQSHPCDRTDRHAKPTQFLPDAGCRVCGCSPNAGGRRFFRQGFRHR